MDLLRCGSSVGELPGAMVSVVSPSWGPGGREPHYLPGSILGLGQSSWVAPTPCWGSGAWPTVPRLLVAHGLG